MEQDKKEKCPDCDFCQMCGESRCRLCRNPDLARKASELGPVFTYGRYEEWKKQRRQES